jgi:flagellar motor switch protein FliG
MRTFLLTAFLVSVAFGRNPSADPARALNRSYENLAHEALSRYFDDGTFLVRAQVELLEEPLTSAPDERGDFGSTVQLPGLPYYTGRSEPVAPAENRISSVQIEILVDTTYTARDRNFIEYLVTLGADLDTSRGDLVMVQRTFFPRDNRAMGPHRKQKEEGWSDPAPESPPAREDSTAEAVPPPKAERDLAADILDRLLALLPLLVVCFTALACAWLLGRAILAGKSDEGSGMASKLGAWRRRRAESSAPRPAVVLPPERPSPVASAASGAGTPSPAPSPQRHQRSELLECFVGNPRLSGQVLKHWIQKDSAKGSKLAGALLAGLDPNLLDMVRDTLGEDVSRAVQTSATSDERATPEEFATVAQSFLKDFRKAMLKQGDGREPDLFGFLEQLNEAQIAHVLKGESAGVAGFALAQISPDKANNLLQKLDAGTRAKLLVGMGNVTQIPRDVYKEMADRLSLKALDVANMKFVAADGVDTILKLIDSLPLDEQFAYIHSISEVDIHLARRLRERTITFAELASLPDRFLAPRLQSLDPETLTLALLRADGPLRTKLMSLLPERQQQMMASSMESRRQADRADLDAAARRLLKAVRDEIRRQGRPQ